MLVTQLYSRINGAAVFCRYFTIYGTCALHNQVFNQCLVCSMFCELICRFIQFLYYHSVCLRSSIMLIFTKVCRLVKYN